MGRGEGQGLSDFLTFVSPCIIIILFFLCLFRFLFTCCTCRSRFGPIETSNVTSTEPIRTHCTLNIPSLPLNYDRLPFIFSTERPPKYEDAIKMPAATPRRSSSSAIPPPFYDNVNLDGPNDFSNQCPPAYWSIRRGTVQYIRPTGSNTISNSANNSFIVTTLPSPSVPLNNSNIPIELSPATLLEKRLRESRPITGINNSAEILPAPIRPFTMHSRYIHNLPGQIIEPTSTASHDYEKTTQ